MSAGPQGRLTKPGTTPLSEIARHIVKPEDIVSTGWPAVRETCSTLSLRFDQWQDGAGRLILAKNVDGLYAADLVVISIPRQVGKTFLIGSIIFALCIIFPGLTVIWTAHRFKLARETFNSMRSMARRPGMFPHVDPKAGITTGAGNEAIVFRNTSRILFGAREQGFGLGFSNVGVLVLDECQRLSQTTMDDLVPTTNQHWNPLIILTGTPPRPKDDGEIFTGLRSDALSGESEEVLYIELSADADFVATPLPAPFTEADWAQIAKVNPSFPHRTSRRAIKRMRKILGDESMMREGFGKWDDDARPWVVPKASYLRCLDTTSEISSTPIFALDISPQRDWAAIGVAGLRADGLPHVEITSRGGIIDHRPGTEWIIPRLEQLRAAFPSMRLKIAAGAGGKTYERTIENLGVPVDIVSPEHVAAACGFYFDHVKNETLRHRDQPELRKALAAAAQANVGDGAFRWSRLRSDGDITCLYAETLALWGAAGEPDAEFSMFSADDLDACDGCGKPAGDDAADRDYLCEACWAERNTED